MHIYLYIEAKTLVYYLQTTKRRRIKTANDNCIHAF